MSRDSREYGPVPRALVRGRVIAQVGRVGRVGTGPRQEDGSGGH